MSLISFFCLFALASASNIILKNSENSRQSVMLFILMKLLWTFLHLGWYCLWVYHIIPSIMLKYILSSPVPSRIFIMKACWMLSIVVPVLTKIVYVYFLVLESYNDRTYELKMEMKRMIWVYSYGVKCYRFGH